VWYKYSSVTQYFDNFDSVANNIYAMITNPAFLEISEKESIMREELQNATDTSTVAYEKKLLLWGDIYQKIQTLFLDCVLESKALDLKIPVFIYFDKNKKQHAKATIDKEIGINAASDKNKDLIYIKSNMAHEITHVISKQKSKTDWWRNEKLLDRTDKKHQSQLSREDQQKFPYYYQSPEEARANLQGLIQKHNNILNVEFVENYSKLHNQSVRKSVHDVIEYCINDIVLKHRQYLPNYTHRDYFGKEYLLFLKKGLYDYIFNQKGTKPIIIMPEPVKKIISDAYKIFEKERYSIGELEAYRNLLSALESEKNKINPETKRSNAIYLQEYVDYVERKIHKLAYVRNVSFNLKKYGEKQNLLISLPDYVYDLLSDISNSGGRALVVGGAVRDAILGKSPKDIDFEVYGLNYDELNQILSKYGKADLVGQSFGVIKFVGKDGMDFDFSLPRLDSKAGVGHKDFNVEVRSDLTPEEAAARRDFTINAISYDPITHEIVDPYNGRQDLTNKILRHTSDAFAEDPLRVLRGMQFASRFGFDIAPETAELAQSIREEFQHLPKERIYEEFKKLVTKGIEPGKALDFLYTTGWSANFPEIHDLKDTPQDSEWHPEGSVDVHTAHVMNEAARIADRENLSPEQREVLIYAALAHDFAKPETTAVTNKKGKDRITSHGHEEKGGPKARAFLESIGAPKKVIDQVVPLVEYHLAHIHHSNTSKQDSFVKNLAEKIYPSNLKMLSYLIEADHSGRPPLEKKLPDEAKTMIEKANELGVFEDKAQDLLQGRDIMVYTKKGGPIIGQILKEHRKMILDHDPRMKNRETALEWLQNRMQREVALINGYDVVENTNLKGRDIKDMLDEAWKAQLNGEFNDKAEALQWMKKNLTKFNTI
jgi:tRNA nucleotidyltransferase (CCA-adding enzyme)